MRQYRKKPVVIEAIQLLPEDYYEWVSIVLWINGNGGNARIVGEGYEPHVIEIETLEGTHYGDPGDWIIRGVKGEFYPCKPDIFGMLYEEVRDG